MGGKRVRGGSVAADGADGDRAAAAAAAGSADASCACSCSCSCGRAAAGEACRGSPAGAPGARLPPRFRREDLRRGAGDPRWPPAV